MFYKHILLIVGLSIICTCMYMYREKGKQVRNLISAGKGTQFPLCKQINGSRVPLQAEIRFRVRQMNCPVIGIIYTWMGVSVPNLKSTVLSALLL